VAAPYATLFYGPVARHIHAGGLIIGGVGFERRRWRRIRAAWAFSRVSGAAGSCMGADWDRIARA